MILRFFKNVARLFESNRNWLKEKYVPGLGTLRLDDDAYAQWRVYCKRIGIEFVIAGYREPDQAIVAYAVELATNFPEFEAAVKKSLNEQVPDFPEYFSNIIPQLEIEVINLLRPKRPKDGLIQFKPVEYEWFQMDLSNGEPGLLGM